MTEKKQTDKLIGMIFNVGVESGSTVELVPILDRQMIEIKFRKSGKSVKPINAVISTYHDRPKGPKIRTQTSSSRRPPVLNHDEALGYFDVVLAVDTNSKVCDGDKISVGCIVSGVIQKNEQGYRITPIPQLCLEFRNLTDNPEKVVWRKVIQMVQQAKGYSKAKTYALIVDSFLILLCHSVDGFNRAAFCFR